jgi:hypothetical protein
MLPTGSIVVQTDRLMANRTFRVKRVKPPFSQKLYKLDYPYGYIAHGCLVAHLDDQNRITEPASLIASNWKNGKVRVLPSDDFDLGAEKPIPKSTAGSGV